MPDRVRTGDYLTQAEAVKEWTAAAAQILVEQEAEHRRIGVWALAEAVQQRSGVTTREPSSSWMPKVLGHLEQALKKAGRESLLSCVDRASAATSPSKGPGTRTQSPRQAISRPRVQQPVRPEPRVCPSCHLQMPLTGVCDNCD